MGITKLHQQVRNPIIRVEIAEARWLTNDCLEIKIYARLRE